MSRCGPPTGSTSRTLDAYLSRGGSATVGGRVGDKITGILPPKTGGAPCASCGRPRCPGTCGSAFGSGLAQPRISDYAPAIPHYDATGILTAERVARSAAAETAGDPFNSHPAVTGAGAAGPAPRPGAAGSVSYGAASSAPGMGTGTTLHFDKAGGAMMFDIGAVGRAAAGTPTSAAAAFARNQQKVSGAGRGAVPLKHGQLSIVQQTAPYMDSKLLAQQQSGAQQRQLAQDAGLGSTVHHREALPEQPFFNQQRQLAKEKGVEPVQGHPWVIAMRSSVEAFWDIPRPGSSEEHFVFLMLGGINMVGRATKSPEIYKRPVGGPAWSCDSGGRAAKGCGEPCHPADGQGPGKGNGVSMGRAFVRPLLKRIPRSALFLCPCACGHGDTSLRAWERDGIMYSVAIARVKRFATACGARIAGVLWHSGEADASNKEDAELFEERLKRILRNLREDLDYPDIPIVLGEIGESFLSPESVEPFETSYKYAKEVNQALRRIGRMPNTSCVGSPSSFHSDRVCFDAVGMEELGSRFADQWERLWMQQYPSEKRVGYDGVAHTKQSWIDSYKGYLCGGVAWASAPREGSRAAQAARENAASHVEAFADAGRRRRRRDDDGDDGGRRRRRRGDGDGEGAERDRRRRRRKDDGGAEKAAGPEGGAGREDAHPSADAATAAQRSPSPVARAPAAKKEEDAHTESP